MRGVIWFAMTREIRFRRALFTFFTAVLIASAAHFSFYAVFGSDGLSASLSELAIRDMLLFGLIQSAFVSAWLIVSPRPAFWIACALITVVTAVEVGITWHWISYISDPIGQSYASLRLLPIAGGAACAVIAYGVGESNS